ncbi:MAG TPA: MFS transporter [Burkholderiales bacterium]|nr:MFS transporter [Burkholderiales bacterium]
MFSSPHFRLSGFYFFYFSFVGAFAPYWPLYLESLNFNPFQIGVLMSLYLATRIVAPAFWGRLADARGNAVSVVQWAAGLSLLTYAAVFFGESFVFLFVVIALMSFFWSAQMPLIEAITLTHLREQTERYGHIRLWGSLGFVGAVVAIGYVLDAAPIGILLWLILTIQIAIVFFSRALPKVEPAPHALEHPPIGQILKQPVVIALLTACFLMVAAHAPYHTFFSVYLADRGYSKGSIGMLWALSALCEVGVFLMMPRLLRAFSLRGILLASFALAVARFLLIGWGAHSPALVTLAQSFHSMTFGAYHGAAVTLIHRFFQGRNQATGQALYGSLTFGLGGTLGGILSGFLWDRIGPAMVFSAASLLAALGLLVVWRRINPP